jgi:cell wall-associated NlpC family hydrolase
VIKKQVDTQLESVVNELSSAKGGAQILIDETDIAIATEIIIEKGVAPEKIDSELIKATLLENKLLTVSAYAITANTNPIALVASQEEAQAVVNALSTKFSGPDETWTGNFKEDVNIVNVESGLDDIEDAAGIEEKILTGGVVIETYKVKEGDTGWGICEQFDIPLDDVIAANPGYDVEKIHVDDEIKLTKTDPLLHYETTGVVTEEEAIGFETQEVKTDTLFEGETAVASEGVLGKKKVTRQEVRVNGAFAGAEEINTEILSEPQPEIINVGTKPVPVEEPAAPPAQENNVSNDQNTADDSNASDEKSTPKKEKKKVYKTPELGNGIVADAYALLGIPYKYGGSSPSSGFDCSGLTSYIYKKNGISIPRTASQQSGAGKYVEVSDLQPGDIVCWDRPGTSHHVGIYVGGKKFIHAPQRGDKIRVTSFSQRKPSFGVRF